MDVFPFVGVAAPFVQVCSPDTWKWPLAPRSGQPVHAYVTRQNLGEVIDPLAQHAVTTVRAPPAPAARLPHLAVSTLAVLDEVAGAAAVRQRLRAGFLHRF